VQSASGLTDLMRRAEHSIPFSPVLDLDHAAEDAYATESGLLSVGEHPTEGPYRVIANPFSRWWSASFVQVRCS
jgi:hypothetical protein